jgi:hypothetical protein
MDMANHGEGIPSGNTTAMLDGFAGSRSAMRCPENFQAGRSKVKKAARLGVDAW